MLGRYVRCLAASWHGFTGKRSLQPFQLHQQLEQALSELKLAKDPERRRFLLREMSRLLAEGHRVLEAPERVPGHNPEPR